MREPKVIIVHLRRPNRSKPNEMRSDPFWEFGSFGLTGCHAHNLMNPKKASELEGVRLAFAQGGKLGTRLVYLSPPIHLIVHRNGNKKVCEATWNLAEMPFRYDSAPLLIDNSGQTDFRGVKAILRGVRRESCVAKLSSKFRSHRRPLQATLARELIGTYKSLRSAARSEALAKTYVDALPYMPPKVDHDREATYTHWKENAGRRLVYHPRQAQRPRRTC